LLVRDEKEMRAARPLVIESMKRIKEAIARNDASFLPRGDGARERAGRARARRGSRKSASNLKTRQTRP
jgi:hypothetical protein